MPSLKRAFQYWAQYGLRSMIGLSSEKYLVDPRRFRSDIKRKVPVFSSRKNRNLTVKGSLVLTERIHVLYLVHYFYPSKSGGTERYVLNLAKYFQDTKHVVCVLTLGNLGLQFYPSRHKGIYYREYIHEGIQVVEFRHKKSPFGLYYKSMNSMDTEMADFAQWILREKSIDIVHAAYPQPYVSFLYECKKMNIPYIVTTTDFNVLCHYSSMVDKQGEFCKSAEGGKRCAQVCKTYAIGDYQKRFAIASDMLSSACAVTAPSEFVAGIIEQEFCGVHVSVIPHGIDNSFLAECPPRRTQTKKFVYAGTLSELKGVHLLIDAFQYIDGELSIYGKCESGYAGKLKKQASRNSNIAFCGAVAGSEMARIYKNADCVVIPSIWYETYNFVLREALACGCLVVASNIGAMPEAVCEGENGFLFEPGDAESLKEALQKASGFDWSNYREAKFPTVIQEGRIYSRIYANT